MFSGCHRADERRGCDAVVLGCTEIPLIMDDSNSPLPTLDSTRLLARAALRRAVQGTPQRTIDLTGSRGADKLPAASPSCPSRRVAGWALRDPRTRGCGRHGRSVQSPRYPSAPHRRPQVGIGSPRRRSPAPRAVSTRSAGRCSPEPPSHLRDSRRGQRRRPRLHRDGVSRWRDARAAPAPGSVATSGTLQVAIAIADAMVAAHREASFTGTSSHPM